MNPGIISSFSYKDLLLRKLYNGVVCSVFSQIIILQLCLVILNIDILHPITWMKSTFNTFTSFSTWLYVIPHITIIFAQCIICAKDYILNRSYCSTRFLKLVSVFSLHNLTLLILHVLIGVVHVWLYLSLAGGKYQRLTKISESKRSLLIEETLFLYIGGLWTGFYFFVKVYVSDKFVPFPVLPQWKVTQFKSKVFPLLRDSLKHSIWPSFYFIIFYYIWGSELKYQISYTLGLECEMSYSMWIYLYQWMFGTLYFFNMNLIQLIFGLFLTEPVEFPLMKLNPNILTLQESINLNTLPIVQSLACLDLYLLSSWSLPRRQLVFMLSQPGEHPHNWNHLIEAVLKLYTSYMELLNKSTESAKPTQTVTGVKQIIDTNYLSLKCQMPTPNKFRNLRNMSLYSPDNINILEVETSSELKKVQVPNATIIKLKTKLTNIVQVIKTVLGINYIFGEIPEVNIQQCLGNGDLIIWTSQGISELVCASLKEDKYGIVQKDIPVLITTLINLKQSLDKLNKLPVLSRRFTGSDDYNFRIKGAISSAIKRSLFNICNNFKQFLCEFPLDKDVINYLNNNILSKS